jgi:hypothetical protein
MDNLVNRAKQMIFQPKATWEVIKTEDTSATNLLTGHLFPLSLIPAIASFIGFGLIGFNTGIFGNATSIEWGISQAITTFASTIVGVIISAWVISQLAPKFGTTLTMNNAVKLVAYAYTPSLVAGVFYLIPSLTPLAIIGGIYSLYVLYIGFQPMTKVSEDQHTTYFFDQSGVYHCCFCRPNIHRWDHSYNSWSGHLSAP